MLRLNWAVLVRRWDHCPKPPPCSMRHDQVATAYPFRTAARPCQRRRTDGSYRQAEKTDLILRGASSTSRPPTLTLRAPFAARHLTRFDQRTAFKCGNLRCSPHSPIHYPASFCDRRAKQDWTCSLFVCTFSSSSAELRDAALPLDRAESAVLDSRLVAWIRLGSPCVKSLSSDSLAAEGGR